MVSRLPSLQAIVVEDTAGRHMASGRRAHRLPTKDSMPLPETGITVWTRSLCPPEVVVVKTFEDVLQWFANNVFNEVAILIGLIVLVGLLLQRKRFDEVLQGVLRATIGVYAMFI